MFTKYPGDSLIFSIQSYGERKTIARILLFTFCCSPGGVRCFCCWWYPGIHSTTVLVSGILRLKGYMLRCVRTNIALNIVCVLVRLCRIQASQTRYEANTTRFCFTLRVVSPYSCVNPVEENWIREELVAASQRQILQRPSSGR